MREERIISRTRPVADTERGASHDLDRDQRAQTRRAELSQFRKENSGITVGWRVDVQGQVRRGTITRFDSNGFVVVRFDNSKGELLVEPTDIIRAVNPKPTR